jgi:hypothetical protein
MMRDPLKSLTPSRTESALAARALTFRSGSTLQYSFHHVAVIAWMTSEIRRSDVAQCPIYQKSDAGE